MVNKIGEKIRRLRKGLGLTLDGLAIASDSSKSYIWEIENRVTQLSAKKIVAIADALKTSPDFLLDDTKEEMTGSDDEHYFLRRFRTLSDTDRAKLDQIIDIFF